MSEQLQKRFKTFFWGLGHLMAVVALDYFAKNIGIFDLPTFWVAVVALITTQGTKYLSK